jgi:two-component system LytT family response regulator
MIRVLIADDDPLARRKMRDLLQAEPDLEVAGEAADGEEAVEAILNEEPDLVLLDVQMPRMDGFEVIRAVGVSRMPPVVFATGHDDFALRAFDAGAVDYLLKPYDRDRLHAALARARRVVGRGDGGGRDALEARLRSLLAGTLPAAPEHLERLLVKSGGQFVMVRMPEVDWIESAANYVSLHVGARSHLHRQTMAGMEQQLDPRQFMRIRSSAIINLDRIASVQPWSRTEYQFTLTTGAKLVSSRRYRDRLAAIMPH